jgi:hypothetical protein
MEKKLAREYKIASKAVYEHSVPDLYGTSSGVTYMLYGTAGTLSDSAVRVRATGTV